MLCGYTCHCSPHRSRQLRLELCWAPELCRVLQVRYPAMVDIRGVQRKSVREEGSCCRGGKWAGWLGIAPSRRLDRLIAWTLSMGTEYCAVVLLSVVSLMFASGGGGTVPRNGRDRESRRATESSRDWSRGEAVEMRERDREHSSSQERSCRRGGGNQRCDAARSPPHRTNAADRHRRLRDAGGGNRARRA